MRPLRRLAPALLLAAFALPPGTGCAQPVRGEDPPGAAARASAPGPAQPSARTAPLRMSKTLAEPLDLTPSVTTPLRQAEPAPIPDRSIEPPRDRLATSDRVPTLEPMILPPERRMGVTFGREHLRETGPDRPLDNVLPGARLRIPFESSGR